MRVLFWYCDRFAWQPAMKTLDDAPEAALGDHAQCVVAFVQVEPKDVEGTHAATRLIKFLKWLTRKWETKKVLLHSFAHLGEEKADPEPAKALFDNVQERMANSGFEIGQTPYGYFLDLEMKAPGSPLARIYQAW